MTLLLGVGPSAVISENIRISALLPVKNGEKYLEELIPVIINMLRFDDELIVVNDGSTDSTKSIIERYSKQETRIRVIQTGGVGLVLALNLGIEAARNPWIARFDVDDQYEPDRLLIQREFASESVAVIFSDYAFTSFSGKYLGKALSALLPEASILSLISSQRTPHPVAVINRDLAIQAGGYSSGDFPAEDLGLWLRISELGDIVSSPTILLKYRLNFTSISRLNRDLQILKKNELIQNWHGWSNAYNSSFMELGNTRSYYLRGNGGYQRLLLHYRDLFLVSRVTKSPITIFKLLKKIGVWEFVHLIPPSFSLLYWSLLRKVYRIFK
jgi:glycosyltransferase involved in cell wall biosynthesis